MSERVLIGVPQPIVRDGVRFAMNQFGRRQDLGAAEALRLASELHPDTRGLLIKHIETELSYVAPDDDFYVLWSPVVDALRSAPAPEDASAHRLVLADERLVVDAIRFSLGLRWSDNATYETAAALTSVVDRLTVDSLTTIAPLIVKRLSFERQPVMSWDDVAPWDEALRTINARLGESNV